MRVSNYSHHSRSPNHVTPAPVQFLSLFQTPQKSQPIVTQVYNTNPPLNYTNAQTRDVSASRMVSPSPQRQSPLPNPYFQQFQTRVQLPSQIHISAVIQTENIEFSPDRFISKLKADLQHEKDQVKELEGQLQQLQGKNKVGEQIRYTSNDDQLMKGQEQVQNLQSKLQDAYKMLIEEIQDEQGSNIKQLQGRHKEQIDKLLEQIEQNNKALYKFKSDEEKRKRQSQEPDLQDKQREIDELRQQLLIVHREFKRMNELMDELVSENNQLQQAYEVKSNELETAQSYHKKQNSLQLRTTQSDDLENLVQQLSRDNNKKSEEIQSLRNRIFSQTPSFSQQNNQSFEQSQSQDGVVKQKRQEIQRLQVKCEMLIDKMCNQEQEYNETQLEEFKFQYQILQEKINEIKYEIVQIQSLNEDDE